MPRVYDLRAWKRARRAQLAEFPLCAHCEARGLLVPATEADHITPIEQGGDWWGPLQSLCKSCHSIKTRAENGATVSMGCKADGIPIDATHHWNASHSQP